MKALCYGEDGGWLRQLREAAEKLGAEEYAAFTPSEPAAEEASKIFEKVYASRIQTYEPNLLSQLLDKASDKLKPQLTLFPCNGRGRVLAGLYAGRRREHVLTDVIAGEKSGETLILTRLVYGGTAKAELEVKLPTTVCVVAGAFPEAGMEVKGEVEWIEGGESRVEAEFKPRLGREVEPERAEIVVAAGRGVKKREDLGMIIELAKALGGAWSVTRPLAADYGWSETWIGISGLTVNPKLYLAIGVSGQPLHLAGARGSKLIAAINSDPNAPIFEEADYGIIGDLYQVVPAILKKLKEK